MSSITERCPGCGLPKSTALDGNCPTCLMWLGTTPNLGETSATGRSCLQASRCLGDYELFEEIARGGMGVVYRARQLSLNREVAVKVLLGGQFADRTFIQRFRREAEAAASLNHPNIVAIHEVGEENGQPYFSMDLIQGNSLAETIQNNALPARQAAQLIRTVARAVAFAHSRRLLHRDLKPSNILLDEQGVPHITDFGLAKKFDGDGDLTVTGQILGSPNYMAPEQAEPSLGPTTAASDVYSLGAVLYHLLTGRPPFSAETVAQTLRLVVEGQPTAPSLLRAGISQDLETICLACLETTPKLRYATAEQLADELDRFLKDEPIRARRVGSMMKLYRWLCRRPALAFALGGVVTLLALFSIASPIALLRIRSERKRSESARQQEAAFRVRAETGERLARQQLYSALIEQADASARSGEIGQRLRTLAALQKAATISNSVELRRTALGALALPDLNFARELPTGAGFTLQLMDPTFERIAVCRGSDAVEIRAVRDWTLKAKLPASTNLPAYVAWWSPDCRYLAVKRDLVPGGTRSDVEVWDTSVDQRTLLLHDVIGHALSFHPTEHKLIAAQVDGAVTCWDLDKSKPSSRHRLNGTPIDLAFSPDGSYFAALRESGDNFMVSVHSSSSGTPRASSEFDDMVSSLAWHPGGRWLALADHSGMVHLMDSQTGERRALGSHKAQAVTVTFSPLGDYLFSGGWEGELLCWDMRTMQRVLAIGRKSWILQFRSDAGQCAIFTHSGIELYEFVRPSFRAFAEDLGPRLRHATFSPDGRWLAASADRYLGVWDLTKNAPALLANDVEEARPAFSVDSTVLFASGRPGDCAGWRLLPGTNAVNPPSLRRLKMAKTESLTSISAASGSLAVTGPKGSAVTVLEHNTMNDFHWCRTADGLNGISADCQWLGIYQPYSPYLCVYRLPDMKSTAILTNLNNIGDFVFTPAGDNLVVSSSTGVEFWSTNTWTRTRALTNFIGILFSPQGSSFWLTTDFRSAGLYAESTLQPLLLLPTGTLPLAVSRDGRRLALSVDARHLQVWDLEEVWAQLRELGLCSEKDFRAPL